MSVRCWLFVPFILTGLMACGGDKDEEGDAPECVDSINDAAKDFAGDYAAGYCDLKDQCISDDDRADAEAAGTPIESKQDCKTRVPREQLNQACNGCELNEEVLDDCLTAVGSPDDGGLTCSEWEDGWGDEPVKRPVAQCRNVWINCATTDDGGDD